MQFTSRKRRGGGASAIVFTLFVLLIGFVAAFHGTIGALLGQLLSAASAPRSETYQALPKDVLAARLASAEEELARIRYQALLYTLTVEENERLSELLAFPEERAYASGRVIARPPRTHYDTLLVSIRDGSGVAVGDRVLVSGALVGTVSAVSQKVATVTLASAPGSAIDARVGEPSAIVVLRGEGGGAFSFEIPKDVALEAGDLIEAAAFGRHVVAVVASVEREPERTSAQVLAHAPFSFSDVRIVEFVRSEEEL